MANLKDVIQHNSVEIIESFKKDLVRYANTLWQHGIVPVGVKNSVLDDRSADEDYRANKLVTNLDRCLRASDNMSKQIEYMKILLNCLEDGEEIELARRMRMELKEDFGIELDYMQPSGVTGSRMSSHHASEVLRNHLVEEDRTRLNIDLNLEADHLNPLRHRNMPTDSAPPQHHPTHKDTDDNHHTGKLILLQVIVCGFD